MAMVLGTAAAVVAVVLVAGGGNATLAGEKSHQKARANLTTKTKRYGWA